jgi:hypothetical protein
MFPRTFLISEVYLHSMSDVRTSLLLLLSEGGESLHHSPSHFVASRNNRSRLRYLEHQWNVNSSLTTRDTDLDIIFHTSRLPSWFARGHFLLEIKTQFSRDWSLFLIILFLFVFVFFLFVCFFDFMRKWYSYC